MLIKVYAAAVQGIEATLVTIEVNCSKGIKFFLVGMPDVAVKESHERIISALQVNGLKFPRCQVVVNMAPADIRKEGAAYDLPLAIGILAASEKLSADKLSDFLLMGELSLDGSLQPIKGVLPMAIQAWKQGYKGIILPKANEMEAAIVKGLEVYGADNLLQVVNFLNSKPDSLQRTEIDIRKMFLEQQSIFPFDFAEVKGQESVKRALEVAAAGGHNLIMVGPPGSGKSMMAKRISSILPPMTLQEALETTKIHSVAGKIKGGASLTTQRPFRSPHHNISTTAMTGGGAFPQPGEISLSHHGVLFLDELPEFSRQVLESMRQPLEDRKITVSRAKYTVDFPSSFMLIASMNPCPCGYFNHPNRECSCSTSGVKRYLQHLSGPLLDRIDIQIEITPIAFDQLSQRRLSESSEQIRARVIQARDIQKIRFESHPEVFCNAQMTPNLQAKYAQLDALGHQLLKTAMDRFNLSARAYDRILKVSRTIADLEGAESILPKHVGEAITYRNLDRDGWGS